MDPLVEYNIPVNGLSSGIHQFDYQIDQRFFSNFEHSPIATAKVKMEMVLEKKPSLYVLQFTFSGTVRTICDRCLVEIDLPIEGEERLLVKVAEETESEDPEVVYLDPEAIRLEVADYIYEFIVLSIPIIKVYDCQEEEEVPCDFDMLDKLVGEPEEETPDPDSSSNPLWEELKKFNSKQ